MTHPSIDFETYSEAGLVWNETEQRWESPPGHSTQKRGLKAVGAHNYVNHPTFELLSLAYNLRDGRGVRRWVPPEQLWRLLPGVFDPAYGAHPWELLAHVARGGILEAHNVAFENYVWEWCVEHWGWPPWPLAQQRCSAAKSRAHAYPGALADVADVLQTTERKDPDGDRLIRKLTMPKNPTKGDASLRWTPATAPADFEALYRYNEQDIRAETAVSDRLPELSPFELEVWQLDQEINRRGMYIDRAGVENCIAILEQAAERADAELRQLTLWPIAVTDSTGRAIVDHATGQPMLVYVPAVKAHTEVAATVRWLAWRGFAVHELDEETVTECLARSDLEPDVRRVLEIRQSLAFGSVKKLYAMREQTSADGRLREQYVYHGAHTSLWNGFGVQPANFPRPMHERFEKSENVERALQVMACRSIELLDYEYPDMQPLEVVASCLRSLICAPPGYRLISADFSAIQAVVTSAIAGEEWRLEVFRTHGKIYEAMAAQLTGMSLDELLEYKRVTGKHHAYRQNPGKLAILSGDFGAWINGWKRFGADKLLGADENIKAMILRTRAAQPMIVELWGGQTRDKFQYNERPELYGLEGAIISALLSPGQAYEYRGIVYQMHGRDLTCRTLDGGLMYYHNAALHRSQRPYAREWEYEVTYEGWNSNALKAAAGWQTMNLYGGVATQNVVSRMSRCIQASALLRLRRAGFPIVHHNHDENVTEVPIGSPHTMAEHTRLTAELPPWAVTPDGLPWPIKVPDSWENSRYGKW